jgi:hypothetical protein
MDGGVIVLLHVLRVQGRRAPAQVPFKEAHHPLAARGDKTGNGMLTARVAGSLARAGENISAGLV